MLAGKGIIVGLAWLMVELEVEVEDGDVIYYDVMVDWRVEMFGCNGLARSMSDKTCYRLRYSRLWCK